MAQAQVVSNVKYPVEDGGGMGEGDGDEKETSIQGWIWDWVIAEDKEAVWSDSFDASLGWWRRGVGRWGESRHLDLGEEAGGWQVDLHIGVQAGEVFEGVQ